jgi:DNA-nicking Smr family endonuclease
MSDDLEEWKDFLKTVKPLTKNTEQDIEKKRLKYSNKKSDKKSKLTFFSKTCASHLDISKINYDTRKEDNKPLLRNDIPRAHSSNYSLVHYSARDIKHISPKCILDLHGFTVKQAQIALIRTINLYSFGWIVVITGKGKHKATEEKGLRQDELKNQVGPIKQMVLTFLSDNPDLIVGYAHPNSNKGGTGILYIHIRKRHI